MKSLGKFLTIAMVAAGFSLVPATKASAYPVSVLPYDSTILTRSAVLDNSCAAPVVDTTLTQPAVLDNSCTTVLTQPAVFDNSCTTVLTQPAIIQAAPVIPAPVIYRHRRHHLFELGTPFFNMGLF